MKLFAFVLLGAFVSAAAGCSGAEQTQLERMIDEHALRVYQR